MPELKETIARLRTELRIAEANGALADLYCGDLRQVLDAAEEVEKLRADKERLDCIERWLLDDYLFEGARWSLPTRKPAFHIFTDNEVGKGQHFEENTLREVIDTARRVPQTNGRVPESTPEAKQEASPAWKEKAE